MAPAYFWKGYLKLSLVTCPVAMTPATSDREKVRFHTVNRVTGNRIRSRYVDSVTGKPVRDANEAKGYEISEGKFVTLDDEELDAVALESTKTIDIDTFVPAESIGWIYYDKPYYLTPNDKVGEEAFTVIRDAMASEGVVGISRVVLYGRERAVMLEPRGEGIVLWTLRYGDEVRDRDAYFAGIAKEKADPKLVALVKALIDDRSKPWDPKMVQDPVQDRLVDLIEQKKKATKKKPTSRKAADDGADEPSNVIDLMSTLKLSLEKSKKK
ncbi:MAG: Ku protein [Mesorhizobium sp.]|nr:Ku protein [Mesorhizobium sp.]